MSEDIEFSDTYDVIIVGAGAAGCVLANRLSSNPSIKVLILEAGGDMNHDINVKTPLRSRRLLGNPNSDWDFKTEPQPHLDKRIIHQPRGRLLGGSTAINSHSLVYPSRAYHDHWAKYGNPSWTWSSIEKYYNKFQTVQHPSSEVANALRIGQEQTVMDGPIKASYPAKSHVLQQAFIESLDNTTKDGFVDRYGVGGSTITNAIDQKFGERSHAAIAYLEPIRHRVNLKIVTNALVTAVSLKQDGSQLIADGIHLIHNEKSCFVKARKEVIICAGAFGSPHILELSGIGSSEILKTCGVTPILDLPGVGENLQDHLNYGPSVEVNPSIQTLDDLTPGSSYAQAAEEEYSNSKGGPLSEGGVYVVAYQALQALNSETDDLELAGILNDIPSSESVDALHHGFIKSAILSPTEASATVFQPHKQRYSDPAKPASGKFITTIAMLSHPFSRGNVHIISKDANIPPKIDFRYLSHPLDLEILGRHTVQIEKLLQKGPLARHIKPNGIRLPAEFPRAVRTVDDAKQILPKYAATNYHPCGTCAMMSRELGGVVDEDLKVHGTTNLRVCDASVFPIIPRGNILTTVYAVAEKAADIIIESWS